jgi:hypothetical protein
VLAVVVAAPVVLPLISGGGAAAGTAVAGSGVAAEGGAIAASTIGWVQSSGAAASAIAADTTALVTGGAAATGSGMAGLHALAGLGAAQAAGLGANGLNNFFHKSAPVSSSQQVEPDWEGQQQQTPQVLQNRFDTTLQRQSPSQDTTQQNRHPAMGVLENLAEKIGKDGTLERLLKKIDPCCPTGKMGGADLPPPVKDVVEKALKENELRNPWEEGSPPPPKPQNNKPVKQGPKYKILRGGRVMIDPEGENRLEIEVVSRVTEISPILPGPEVQVPLEYQTYQMDIEGFKDLFATVNSEVNPISEEAQGVTWVIKSRAALSSIALSDFSTVTIDNNCGGARIDGRKTVKYTAERFISLDSLFSPQYLYAGVMKGVLAVIQNEVPDPTVGAYFWDDIRSFSKPGNYFFVRMYPADGSVGIYYKTNSIGDVIFMAYNPNHPIYGNHLWP